MCYLYSYLYFSLLFLLLPCLWWIMIIRYLWDTCSLLWDKTWVQTGKDWRGQTPRSVAVCRSFVYRSTWSRQDGARPPNNRWSRGRIWCSAPAASDRSVPSPWRLLGRRLNHRRPWKSPIDSNRRLSLLSNTPTHVVIIPVTRPAIVLGVFQTGLKLHDLWSSL